LFKKLNKTSIEVPYNRESGWNIGGWMIVLGIGISISILVHVVTLFNAHYYSVNAWEIFKSNGSYLVMTVMFELFFQLVYIFSAISVLYWFLQRRDIFPRMFLSYIVIMFIGELAMLAIYSSHNCPESYGDLASQTLME